MTLPPLSLFAVVGLFAVTVGARADDPAAPAVRDDAQLFSPAARQKADAELAGIRDAYHLDFVLETVAAPPDDVRKQLQAAKNNAQKELVLRAWGEQWAKADAVEGVHILICKDVDRTWYGRPYGSVVVTVPPEARGQFTDADARALHGYLRWFTLGQNKARNDAILGAALARVREDLAYNGRPPFPWLSVSGVLIGVLGLWGVLGLVRRRLIAAAPSAAAPEPGRLALYNGLLGGMFGAPAAHWIYDTLFVAASRSAPVETPAPAEQAPAATADAERILTKAERMDLAARDESVTETGASAPARS